MKLGVILVALLVANAVRANEASRSLEDVTVISNGDGAGRILFTWDSQVAEAKVAIWKARLRLTLAGAAEGRFLPVVLYPITRPWNPASVSWESGWQTPGGDFDESLFAHGTLNLGASGEVSLDVTSIAKEVIESGHECHGFVLTIDRSEGIGFAAADLARFESLGNATIEVAFRSTPPLPRAVAQVLGR